MNRERKESVAAAFEAATRYAILKMGVAQFRETSFFGEVRVSEEKLAA